MFNDPAPSLPKWLVIEVPSFTHFREVLANLERFGIDEECALADLLDNIHLDHEAEFQLSASNAEMLYHSFDGQMVEDPEVVRYAQARMQLAYEMLSLLRSLRAYDNGRLFYQFDKFSANAFILQKLQTPLNEHDKHARALTRQASIADRYYIPRNHLQNAWI